MCKAICDVTLNKTQSQRDDLPGKSLIGCFDKSGGAQQVKSATVKDRILEPMGRGDTTAKTFLARQGSVVAIGVAVALGALSIKRLDKALAARLRNSPTIARNS